jgi:prepilin-type processing-associated H-X9-DG protein
MRELYAALVSYSQQYRGYCLPAQASSSLIGGGSSDWWWLGTQTLGRVLGIKGSQQNVLDRLAQLLNCPSIEREKIAGSNFSFDYTYNSNLGDIRGEFNDASNSNYTAYSPAHRFKKWTQVPGNVLVLTEANNVLVKDDERFDTLEELTWKKAYTLSPHNGRKKSNALFHDGSVKLVRGYTPLPGMLVNNLAGTNGTAPSPNVPHCTPIYAIG